ncbi:MAG: hypothetical protein M1828_005850 [Chrysothrix sp. TS-e1954]|nr:MAG: hypothetical protein M1828_005850 [Chrysothrix sp. TS-e1954]
MALPPPPSNLPPFATHLSFFASRSSQTLPLTLLSSLRASLALGLNFPLALALAISLRLLYGSPFTLYLASPTIASLPRSSYRTQLEHVDTSTLPQSRHDNGLDFGETMRHTKGLSLTERTHVAMFWNLAADTRSNMVSMADLKAFQKGTVVWDIAKRRSSRDNGQVLPFWRGGPFSVAGHAWFVDKLFGVKVYQASAKAD